MRSRDTKQTRRRPGMNRVIRWSLRATAALAALAAVAATGGLLWLRTSLPELDGEIAVPNLAQPVEILRDEFGVPTIRAANSADAAFALGYTHAQDRFAQMELMRRTGAGRLSEVIGDSMLAADRYFRGLGLYERAAAQAKALSPDLRRTVEAYSAGVNAWLETRTGALPWELAVAFHTPEPWQPADSLVWGRLMALRLTYNWSGEALRARLSDRLTPAQLADLWPDTGGDGAIAAPLPATAGGGSNVWAVAGERILANDPHLGLKLPNVWYLARIETPDGVLAGATTPGVPLLVLGHNGSMAWGMTTTHADTADLVKQPDIVGATREVIALRGGETREIEIRKTRRGVIVSDISDRMPDGWALEGPLFDPDDRTVEALARMNRAQTPIAFLDALRDFHAPHQNVFFADTKGFIGSVAAGRVPLRPKAAGFVAADRRAWRRYIPFDRLPRTLNPPDGRIVNANDAPVDRSYPYYIGREWAPPFRARRIEDLLDAGVSHDRIQNDTVSLAAQALLPHLLTAVDDPALSRWNGDMDRLRTEPVLYMAWVREAMRTIFADELGEDFGRWWRYRPWTMLHVLERRPAWCDDGATEARESCAERLALAHAAARSFLRDRYGSELPPWGEVHRARFAHPVAGRIPGLRDLIDRDIENGGGPDTVNAGAVSFRNDADPFRQVHGPLYRAIYDLSDLDESLFIQALGQSENPFSPHYDDLLEHWRDGKYIKLAAPADPAHRYVLKPK